MEAEIKRSLPKRSFPYGWRQQNKQAFMVQIGEKNFIRTSFVNATKEPDEIEEKSPLPRSTPPLPKEIRSGILRIMMISEWHIQELQELLGTHRPF